MMLIVLDKNPILAAQLVPNKLKFKQLLELAQMICSCGYSNIYKKNTTGQRNTKLDKTKLHMGKKVCNKFTFMVQEKYKT